MHPQRTRTALLIFLASLTLYAFSAARCPQWADSSKLTLYAICGYFPSMNPGDHPGWTVFAWFLMGVVGLPPHVAAVTLSILPGAAVPALVFLLLEQRLGWKEAVAASVVTAVAHPLWWSASLTETYCLSSFMALLAALLVSRPLLFGVLAGWAIATHAFSGFLLLGALLAARDRVVDVLLKPASFLSAALGFVVGTSPVWGGLFVHMADPLTSHLSSGPASIAWHVFSFLNVGGLLKGGLREAALLCFGLGPVALFSMLKGLRRSNVPVLVLAFVYFAVVALYAPYRQHLMVLFEVLLIVLAVPVSFGKAGHFLHGLCQLAFYVALPMLLTFGGHGGLGVRQLPFRNNAFYFLCPVKTWDCGAARYAEEILSMVDPSVVVVSDFNPGAVLSLYRELKHDRRDFLLIPTAIDEALAAPDPARVLADLVDNLVYGGFRVVFADTWDPYYRLSELKERFGFCFAPFGHAVEVVFCEAQADSPHP